MVQQAGDVSRTAPWWVWLFPASQLMHGAEELLQGYGFHGWLRSFGDAAVSPADVASLHLAFTAAILVAVVVAVRFDSARWLIASLAVLVLVNAAAHVGVAVFSPAPTSGLVTAVAVWLPLGVGALACERRELPPRRFWGACAVGAGVQVPVSWLAYSAGG